MRQPDQHHFSSTCRARRAFRFRNTLQEHLPDTRQRADRHIFGKLPAAHALHFAQRRIVGSFGNIFEPGDQMGEIGQIRQDDDRIGAGLVLRVEFGKRRRDVALHDMLEQVDDAGAVGKAQHAAHGIRMHAAAAMGDRLVEQRKAVAGGAFGGTRDHRQCFLLGRHAFLLQNGGKQADQICSADPAQVEALATGKHGDRNLADFRRRENELHMLRWLFERLQQPVEGLRREHVHFVDNIDLVARRNRAIAHLLDDLSDIVDTGMGRGIHLDHVDMPAFHDRLAMFAGFAQVDCRTIDFGRLVVEPPSKNTCGRRLADTADTGQHVGLCDTAGLERIGQRADHRFLADHQVGEILRPVLAGENPISRAARRGRG
ncbi:hypothetical protein D3C73_821810 [compost metagenome]